MPLKQRENHNLSEERANIASKSRETWKEKIVLCNEKEVNGIIAELQSFQGLVEFKIQNRKERVQFFKNRVIVNGKKLDKYANLLDILEVGAKVRLKVKPLYKTGSKYCYKVLEIDHSDKKLDHKHTSASHSIFTQNKTAYTSNFNQMISQCGNAPWRTTVSKFPYIDGATGTVVNILSHTTGIVLTDPDNYGACKVFFEINNLFINGEECKGKSLSMCLHIGQSVCCTATKANEKDGVEYKAFAVWIGRKPLFATIISCYVPKMKISNLTKGTVYRGTVKQLAPPKAAILALDPDNYAVMFLSYLRNIKPDAYGWIGDYVQIGETLLVQISGHFYNLCYAVSKAWKGNDWYKENSGMLGQIAEVSSESTRSSCISLNKSSQIAGVTNQDAIGSKGFEWMQNESYSIPESSKNGNKLAGNNGADHLFEERESQKMKEAVLSGRTGKVLSYITKSRGWLTDHKLGYVKFHKAVVLFPAALGHRDVQEYLPVGTTVYYNSVFLEKKQTYVCTKVWIGKKEKQADFESRSLTLKYSSTVLLEGGLYEAVVFELQMPHGLIARIKTADMEVPLYVSLRILQLYPDGPFIYRKCPVDIKCGDALFVHVHYNDVTNERRLNWVASKAWLRWRCADFEKQSALAAKTKIKPRSIMNGRLTLVTSNSGELSREVKPTVFFSNKNAFLFEINLGQMDLQKVFIEGETLHYILQEDSDETYMEASKVWYGTLDNKESLNENIDALIGYWMKRGLDKPTLRSMIKELKRQHAEQNLSNETKVNSIGNGDSNISCVSSEKLESDIVELKRQQDEQNLQITLKGTALSNFGSSGSNFSSMYFNRDVKATNIDETESKTNTKLHGNDTQGLTNEESTVHAGSVTNKLPIALSVPCMTGYGQQQNMISTDISANRELSALAFENKQLSPIGRLKQEVLPGLLRSLVDGLLNPTILHEVQILLKPVLQKYNDEETETLKYLLKQMETGFGRGLRQLRFVEDMKSRVVNLSEQEEHMETTEMNEDKLKKEKCVVVSYKDCSVKSRDYQHVDAMCSYSGATQCLLNEESNDVTEVFHDTLQSDTEHTNNKTAAKQKKYANKEVQTISTGDILYFEIVPDV